MRKNFQKNMNKDHKQKHKEETRMKKGTLSREGGREERSWVQYNKNIFYEISKN